MRSSLLCSDKKNERVDKRTHLDKTHKERGVGVGGGGRGAARSARERVNLNEYPSVWLSLMDHSKLSLAMKRKEKLVAPKFLFITKVKEEKKQER